jgi:hypothetical protein
MSLTPFPYAVEEIVLNIICRYLLSYTVEETVLNIVRTHIFTCCIFQLWRIDMSQ